MNDDIIEIPPPSGDTPRPAADESRSDRMLLMEAVRILEVIQGRIGIFLSQIDRLKR